MLRLFGVNSVREQRINEYVWSINLDHANLCVSFQSPTAALHINLAACKARPSGWVCWCDHDALGADAYADAISHVVVAGVCSDLCARHDV